MKRKLLLSLSTILIIAAGIGFRFEIHFLTQNAVWYLGAGVIILFYLSLNLTFYRQGKDWFYQDNHPHPIRITWLDYIKSLISWIYGFKRTYVVEPGLFFTGPRYDQSSPLLVTANYRLTVFSLLRHLKGRTVRMLIIDTEGINVWCSSGKQRFNVEEIRKQIDRYETELLTDQKRLELILPKLALSGVTIQALRKAGIKPVIGPVYAKNLPAYLDHPPYRDQKTAKVEFGVVSRLFTWLPGFVQTGVYFVYAALVFRTLLIPAPIWLLLILAMIIVTAYPLLFPWLPGRLFAIKGLWLAGVISIGLSVYYFLGDVEVFDLFLGIVFTFATGLFFALSYTGNSAVSNYTSVRKETARFLPPTVVLYLIFIVASVIKGVLA